MEIKNPYLAKMATGNAEDDLFLLRFSMYLHTVVRKTAGAYWAKQRQLERIEVSVDLNEIDGAFESQDSYCFQDLHGFSLMDSVSDELLLTALKTLTKKQREVLIAYVIEDRPIEEIAKQRTISSVGVYNLLSRAIGKLRDKCGKGV